MTRKLLKEQQNEAKAALAELQKIADKWGVDYV